MSLQNIKIWVSPLTNTIYAGYFNKDGTTARQKIDVTDQVRMAVMQHFDQSEGEYWECPAGDLHFTPRAREEQVE